MVDKQQDSFSDSELDDFHDDLLDDHLADQKFGSYDTATDATTDTNDSTDLHDDLSGFESSDHNNSQLQRRTGLIETLKTYGIVILVFGVVGYFGLKYSLRSVPKNNVTASNTTSSTTAIPAPASAAPLKVDSDPVTPPAAAAVEPSKSFDPLQQLAQTSAPASMALNSSTPTLTTATQNDQNDELKKELQTLKASVTDINQKLVDSTEKGKTGIATVEQQLQQFAIYMEGLNKGVSVLSSQIQKQQKVLEGLVRGVPIPTANQNINQNINQNTKNTDNHNMVVEAVISGRAWIKTSKSGHTLSVGIGDSIPGYGKVIDIDQGAGSILTDRGAKFNIN